MANGYFLRVYQGKGSELRRALAFLYPEFSYNEINRFLRQKYFFVNGKRVSGGELQTGDTVEVYCTPDKVSLTVAFSDDNISVIYKKRGLRSDGDFSFEGLVKYKFGDNYVLMHRLDTNTEGLLIFAKNQKAQERIRQLMDEGKVEKHYYASVNGRIAQPIVIKGWLKKNSESGIVKVFPNEVRGAYYCETAVYPLSYSEGVTLAEAVITKGRTHQIRAMLAYSGHFVIGDSKYGKDSINRAKGFSKQQLTAYKLVLNFPTEGFLGYLGGNEIAL